MAKISPPFPSARIHILETTDLHMQLLPFDYFTEKPAEGSGLIALVQNISDIRAKAGSGVFLFDNGDFLQGNPTADFVASLPEDDTDQLAVATNSYRAHGGGGFFKVGPNDVLDVTATGARDLLVDYLRRRGTVTGQTETVWRFAPLSSAHAAVYSAPQAKPQSRPHKLRATQTTADEFAVFDLKL